MGPATGLLYVPIAVWVATGVALLLVFRTATTRLVLRLAAAFLALWSLLATTVTVWVVANGGWPAIVRLAQAPGALFAPQGAVFWVGGALGALVVFGVAFTLNQLVGRGLLRLLAPTPLPWPARFPRPPQRTSLLAFDALRPEAFSFTLLEPPSSERRRWHRHEVILLSRELLARFDADERDATIAHELAHVGGLDGRYLTFLRTLARMMRWDPVLASSARVLTRREEFTADLVAARTTRNPRALARALYKAATASPPSRIGASGFVGPGGRDGLADARRRIERLLALADSGEFGSPPDGSSSTA